MTINLLKAILLGKNNNVSFFAPVAEEKDSNADERKKLFLPF